MVALVSERRVFMWHVRPMLWPTEAQEHLATSLDDIVGLLESEWTAKRGRVFLAKGSSKIIDEADPGADPKNQLYIADIKRDTTTKTVTVLMNRGDPETAPTAFLNIPEAKVRTPKAGAPETPGWSAHLVISTEADARGRHRAAFEQMPKVSSGLVEMALSRILERAVVGNPAFVYSIAVKKAGKPKMVQQQGRPYLDAARVPSENLSDDLDKGSLTSVTLTRRKRYYAGVGASDVIRYEEEKVVIHTAPVEKKKILETLGAIIEKAKDEGFEKVSFHLDKLPGNATNNPTIDLSVQDALEHLYVRALRLDNFSVPLDGCYAETCKEIESKMVAIVNDQSKW